MTFSSLFFFIFVYMVCFSYFCNCIYLYMYPTELLAGFFSVEAFSEPVVESGLYSSVPSRSLWRIKSKYNKMRCWWNIRSKKWVIKKSQEFIAILQIFLCIIIRLINYNTWTVVLWSENGLLKNVVIIFITLLTT